MAVDLDQYLENADWTKQTWDLPPQDGVELDQWLEDGQEDIEEFVQQPRFLNALPNTPWLQEWARRRSMTAAYVESEHPRDPGGEGGGQWIPKGTVAEGETIPEEDGTEALLEKHQAGWRESLSERERQVINIYSQTGFSDYNAVARGEPLPPDTEDHWYRYQADGLERATQDEADLRAAISRAEVPAGATFYRKARLGEIGGSREELQRWLETTMPVGSEIELSRGGAYVSASARAVEAANFSSPASIDTRAVLFRIDNPRRGAYIEPMAKLGGESEVLIPPGMRYRVKRISIERVRDYRDLTDQLQSGVPQYTPIVMVTVEEVDG